AAVAETASDYRGEQYLERPGQVTARAWSPNRLAYSVASPTSNVLVVNQNYDPGWQAEPGASVFDDRGRPAVSIPAGQTTVSLTYDPPSFRAGLAIALLTAMAAFVALARVRVSAGSLPVGAGRGAVRSWLVRTLRRRLMNHARRLLWTEGVGVGFLAADRGGRRHPWRLPLRSVPGAGAYHGARARGLPESVLRD